jgi:hypothetical protein
MPNKISPQVFRLLRGSQTERVEPGLARAGLRLADTHGVPCDSRFRIKQNYFAVVVKGTGALTVAPDAKLVVNFTKRTTIA